MFGLPIELKDIILRFAGIYYPKTEEQLLFNVPESLTSQIDGYLELIIQCDDLEALKLCLSYVIPINVDDVPEDSKIWNQCPIFKALILSVTHCNSECLDYLHTTYPDYLKECTDYCFQDLVSVAVKHSNLDFFTFINDKFEKYVPFDEIMNCCPDDISFEFFQLLCQEIFPELLDKFQYHLYRFVTTPKFLDYIFDIITPRTRHGALCHAVRTEDNETCQYLLDRKVNVDANVMKAAVSTSIKMVTLIHQHLAPELYDESIIQEIRFYPSRCGPILAFLLEHHYPMSQDIVLHAIKRCWTLDAIEMLIQAGCYRHPQALKQFTGYHSIYELLTKYNFPIAPDTILHIIDRGDDKLLSSYYYRYHCTHHPDIYQHIMAKPWMNRKKADMLAVCFNHGYRLTQEIYDHALRFYAPEITLIIEYFWSQQY